MNPHSTHARCAVPILWVAATCLGTIMISCPGQANPLPPGAIVIHVQPVDPDFCTTNTIQTCSQIDQITDATGPLEFDVFLMPMEFMPPVGMVSLQTQLHWPETWQLLDHEICHDGEGNISVTANEATLDVAWPACPQMTGEVFLAARFVMNVTDHGYFGDESAFENILVAGCPNETSETYLILLPAEAGVECSYCVTPCDFDFPCKPIPDPEFVELIVPLGDTAQEEIQVVVTGGFEPCTPSFQASEDWMSLQVTELEWYEYLVTLTVDTSELLVGEYEGWVRIQDECVGCTAVNLLVLPPSAVDDNGEVIGPGPQGSTWGCMKALYR